MPLREKQSLFCSLVAKLIIFAYAQGYELTFGEVLRSIADAKQNAQSGAGISNSLHLLALAVDFHLFKDGVYLQNTIEYKILGDYWKSLNPLCRWGGDFTSRPDGNHFSLEHMGVR